MSDPTLDTEENNEPAVAEDTSSTDVGSMLDAVNGALEPKSAVTDTPAESVDTDTDEELETEVEEEGGGLARGPDGKFLKKGEKPAEGEQKPEDKAAVKPGEQKPEDKAAKKVDPVNDPIPDGVSQRTRERMQSLIETVKQKDVVLEQQAQIFRTIEATGATPDDFGAMVTFFKFRGESTPESLGKARDMLIHQLRDISLKMGQPAPGIDFINDHADLVQQVNSGQIPYDTAQELAMQRTRAKAETERQKQTQQRQQQTTQQQEAERTSAIASLNELGATLSENDPMFEDIMKVMPNLATLGESAPPSQWKAAFMTAYKAAKVQLTKQAAAPTGQEPKPGNSQGGKPQPLRANKNPAGGQARQAANLQDAIFGDGFPT